MNDIGPRMARGVAWMVLFKLIERSIGFVSTLILARLLMPADFGLVAMATSVIAMLELLSAFSFDTAIIQKPDAGRELYDTAWTLNVLFAVGIAGILVLISGPAAHFYGEPRLQPVMIWLAAGSMLWGFENIGVVAFRKDMEFRKEFRFLLAKKVVAFCVTVPLAIMLQNYWALVAGTLAGRLMGVLMSYAVHPYRPRISFAGRGELFHFSKWMFLNNLLSFFESRGADFVIGKMVGPYGLGLYSIAYEISNLPTTELVAPINRAVFPGYAQLVNDRPNLARIFLNVLSGISLLALPAGMGIAILAEPLVQVFLGPKWMECVPLMRIMAVYGVLNALESNFGSIYLALGRPNLITLLFAARVVITVPCLVVGVMKLGILGAALGLLVAPVCLLVVVYRMLLRNLALPFSALVAVVWRPLVSTASMLATLHVAISWQWPGPQGPVIVALVELLLLVAAGVGLYFAVLFGLWALSGRPEGAEHALLVAARARLGRQPRAA